MIINKVKLDTHCLEDMHTFYTDTLGCELVRKDTNSFQVNIGTSVLEFRQSIIETKPFYHFAFNIPANQFRDAKQWLQQKGIPLNREQDKDEAHFEAAAAYACYFYDPAGNIVEFIARKESIQSTQPFSIDELLGISEINLTTPNVVQVANRLATFGLVLRDSEQPKKNGFHFVGEKEDGNFLLLGPPNRRWIFSNRNAEIHPLSIVINNRVHIQVYDDGEIDIKEI